MTGGGAGPSLFLDPEPADDPAAPDEPPAGPAAPLVVVEGGRRRWLQVIVVAVVLVGGVVANRTTTAEVEESEAARRARAEAVESTGVPAAPAPSLRTIDRLGPLLPEPTGTSLVVAAGTQVLVVDVDSGTVRSVQVADLVVRAAYPWGSPVLPVDDVLVVRGQPPDARLVPRADGGPVRDLDAGSGGGLHPSSRPGHLWVEERRGDARLTEVDLGGVPARTVPIPDGRSSIVWDGSGFVQTVEDVATAFPLGGRPRALTPGLAVAADASTVAVVRCGEGAPSTPGERPSPDAPVCGLSLLDRASGAVRDVALTDDVASFRTGLDGPATTAALSADGRWLLVGGEIATSGDPGLPGTEPGLVLVDVQAGAISAVEPGAPGGVPAGSFSPDGRFAFVVRPASSVAAEVAAVRLADGVRTVLGVELSVRAGFGLSLTAIASEPADLGADEG